MEKYKVVMKEGLGHLSAHSQTPSLGQGHGGQSVLIDRDKTV